MLLDVGENVGGGTRGDSTVLAHALHGQEGVFVVLTDSRGAAAAHSAGIGADITLTLGSGLSESVRGTIDLSGKVTHLSNGSSHSGVHRTVAAPISTSAQRQWWRVRGSAA